MTFRVTAELHATEDPDKVIKAMTNIFPGNPRIEAGRVELETEDLSRFRELAEQRKIRDALVALLEKSHAGGHAELLLDRQAALMGKVNVYAGSELGAIRLEAEIEKEEIREMVYGAGNE